MTQTISNTDTALEARRLMPPAPSGRKRHVAPDPDLSVIYSRFSTTSQKEISIERQEEACEQYAAANGMIVVHKFADRARSGGYIVGRDDLELMMKAARAGEFGSVLVENVDRVARDLGFLSTCFKTLENLGISIHQPGRGKLTLTDIAFQGLMGDEGRRMLSERTQHSRRVMAREGRVPTGHCFGYTPVLGQAGRIVIDDRQAAIVRRIYQMRLDGIGVREICSILSREGVTFPRTGRFTTMGVRGILKNQRYTGVAIFGRTRSRKDRETGILTVTERPRSEWIVTEQPHLRIVDADTWERVQDMRKINPATAPARPATSYMLSGLAKCRSCGGNMTVHKGRSGHPRYVCGSYLKDGICVDGLGVNLRDLERLVLGLLAERLGAPAFAEAYVDAYNEEGSRAEKAHADTRADLERKVAQLTRTIDASFKDALTQGFSTATHVRVRAAMERELTEVEGALATLPRRTGIARLDQGKLAALSGTFRDVIDLAPFRPTEERGYRVVKAIRDLVERIEVRGTRYRSFDVDVRLRLNRMIDRNDVAVGDLGAARLTASFVQPDGAYRAGEKFLRDAGRHATGEFDLTDGDWEAVDALIPDDVLTGQNAGPRRRRATVEALIFMAMTGAIPAGIPEGIGKPPSLTGFILDLRATGTWDRIAMFLAERHPDRFADLPARQFADDCSRTKAALHRRAVAYRERMSTA